MSMTQAIYANLKRVFVKPGQMSKHLQCSICCDIFINPQRLDCGHTYCKKCMDEWLKSNQTCPHCRSQIDLRKITRDMIAHNIIEDEDVFCINEKYCNWKGQFKDLTFHVKSCKFQEDDLTKWLDELSPEKPAEEQLIDEDLQDKYNENIPKGSLMQRLYSKGALSREFFNDVKGSIKPSQNSQAEQINPSNNTSDSLMKIDESIKESNLDTKSDGDMDFFEDLLDNPEKFGCQIEPQNVQTLNVQSQGANFKGKGRKKKMPQQKEAKITRDLRQKKIKEQ